MEGASKATQAAWRHIAKHTIEVRDSEIHGKGVFAKVRIPKNMSLGYYGGRRITAKESERRSRLPDSRGNYLIASRARGKDMIIDGHPRFPEATWVSRVNDAHQTGAKNNCRYTFLKHGGIGLRANREIREDEELLAGYGRGYWSFSH